MNQKVKELFNKIYENEERERKINPFRHRRRTMGMWPSTYFEVAPITDFTHFINCEVSPTICPMQWEDLTVDFTSTDKRHCEHCDKFVYKVDNEFMIQKMHDEKKCMAISNTLLDKMNGKMDVQKYKNLQDRLSISMLFLVYKSTFQYEYKCFLDDNLTQEQILKAIILNILNPYEMERIMRLCDTYHFDIEEVLHSVLTNIDDAFRRIAEEKIEAFFSSDK